MSLIKQSTWKCHPELQAALDLFFQSLCEKHFDCKKTIKEKTETEKPDTLIEESHVKHLLDFFTDPKLEEKVEEKLSQE